MGTENSEKKVRPLKYTKEIDAAFAGIFGGGLSRHKIRELEYLSFADPLREHWRETQLDDPVAVENTVHYKLEQYQDMARALFIIGTTIVGFSLTAGVFGGTSLLYYLFTHDYGAVGFIAALVVVAGLAALHQAFQYRRVTSRQIEQDIFSTEVTRFRGLLSLLFSWNSAIDSTFNSFTLQMSSLKTETQGWPRSLANKILDEAAYQAKKIRGDDTTADEGVIAVKRAKVLDFNMKHEALWLLGLADDSYQPYYDRAQARLDKEAAEATKAA